MITGGGGVEKLQESCEEVVENVGEVTRGGRGKMKASVLRNTFKIIYGSI